MPAHAACRHEGLNFFSYILQIFHLKPTCNSIATNNLHIALIKLYKKNQSLIWSSVQQKEGFRRELTERNTHAKHKHTESDIKAGYHDPAFPARLYFYVQYLIKKIARTSVLSL